MLHSSSWNGELQILRRQIYNGSYETVSLIMFFLPWAYIQSPLTYNNESFCPYYISRAVSVQQPHDNEITSHGKVRLIRVLHEFVHLHSALSAACWCKSEKEWLDIFKQIFVCKTANGLLLHGLVVLGIPVFQKNMLVYLYLKLCIYAWKRKVCDYPELCTYRLVTT